MTPTTIPTATVVTLGEFISSWLPAGLFPSALFIFGAYSFVSALFIYNLVTNLRKFLLGVKHDTASKIGKRILTFFSKGDLLALFFSICAEYIGLAIGAIELKGETFYFAGGIYLLTKLYYEIKKGSKKKKK